MLNEIYFGHMAHNAPKKKEKKKGGGGEAYEILKQMEYVGFKLQPS